MKRFSKLLMSVAAVSAVSAAMAVSAMADDFTATYTAPTETEPGKVKITDVAGTGASQTLLILNDNDAQTVTESMIIQIDQKDTVNGVEGTFNGAEVAVAQQSGEALEPGTYFVRIGGSDGSLKTAQFDVSGSDTPGDGGDDTDEYVTVIFGDADNEDGLDSGDITKVARGVAGSSLAKGLVGKDCEIDNKTVIFGDADNEDGLDSGDITKVARGVAGSSLAKGYVGQDCKVKKTDLP